MQSFFISDDFIEFFDVGSKTRSAGLNRNTVWGSKWKTEISSPLIGIEYKAPIEQYTGKLYTGIQITGKLTPEAYAKVSKALPSAFKQTLGGITTEQITKQLITSPKMIKVATDIIGVEYPSSILPKLMAPASLMAKAIKPSLVKPKHKGIKMPKQFSIPKAEEIAVQFSAPFTSIKTSELLESEAKLTQTLKLEQLTTQISTEQVFIPKVKIPSKPFKIKSKRKKGKLSPLLYGWGWMISPVMEPPEVMKLMLGGGKK